jgi:hypothetical protein
MAVVLVINCVPIRTMMTMTTIDTSSSVRVKAPLGRRDGVTFNIFVFID